jgi:GTP cyclohydrolase I
MLEGLGLDLTDPNLIDTPERIAKMYCNELMGSLNKEAPTLKTFPNVNYDEIILFDNIPYTSLCSHHLLPFSGRAWLAYLPDKELIGASKSARLINYFSGKPQLQEKLGVEVVDYLSTEINPKGVMLVMGADHGCMGCRGGKTGFHSGMITSITRGVFREVQSAKEEVMQLIHLSIMDKG